VKSEKEILEKEKCKPRYIANKKEMVERPS
jgi:hypothetical protein